MSMFEDLSDVEENNELDKVIDKLKETYGKNIINKASQFDKF